MFEVIFAYAFQQIILLNDLHQESTGRLSAAKLISKLKLKRSYPISDSKTPDSTTNEGLPNSCPVGFQDLKLLVSLSFELASDCRLQARLIYEKKRPIGTALH